MSNESKGRDLFIVDNSVSGWTGLRYLEEWSEIARAFDIATGYFEIGGLLAREQLYEIGKTRRSRSRIVARGVVGSTSTSPTHPFLDGAPIFCHTSTRLRLHPPQSRR